MKNLLPELPQALLPFAERAPAGETPRKWWDLRAAADGETELLIYGDISRWDIDAAEFVRDLSRIKATSLAVRINSPGGDVFGGVAIHNALVRHPANVTVHVDALAASAASIIAMAGDTVVMHAGSFLMIHDPFVLGIGNAEEFRALAEWLDKISASMATIYAARTGIPEDEIRTLMREETWMTAADAEERGFADQVEEAADVEARFDLSAFAHVPEQLAGQIEAPAAKTPRDAERALRDAGFSREAAKGIVAAGYKATKDPRDAADEPDSAAAERLQLMMLNARLENFGRTIARN